MSWGKGQVTTLFVPNRISKVTGVWTRWYFKPGRKSFSVILFSFFFIGDIGEYGLKKKISELGKFY